MLQYFPHYTAGLFLLTYLRCFNCELNLLHNEGMAGRHGRIAALVFTLRTGLDCYPLLSGTWFKLRVVGG